MPAELPLNLSQSEEIFGVVFRFCPDAILVQDFETREILDVNAGFERLFGYSRDEVLGRTPLGLGLWARPKEQAELNQSFLAGQPVKEAQVFGRRKDGAVRIVLLSLQTVELRGRPSNVAVVRDITERLSEEQALRESEERFSKIFRSSPDAIAIVDVETGRLIEANPSYERMFGYTRKELIGRTTLELKIYQDPNDRVRLLEGLRPNGSIRSHEIPCRHRNGEPIVVEFSGEVIEMGGRMCVVSVIHDVTESKRASARELASRQEFTRRLIASQEAERRRIAGELHDSLGQDLLLIKNRAALALKDLELPAQQRSPLENIQDMAALAIAEVRRISHDLRPYQLDHLGLSRALEAMIASAARNTGFPFERQLDPVDDLFPGEAATHLYRVLQECVNNILKHSRATRARIELQRDIRDVRLTIEDNGRGFDPAASRPAANPGGFGLGNIGERVRLLGGAVDLQSAAGQGTRIAITIPFPPE